VPYSVAGRATTDLTVSVSGKTTMPLPQSVVNTTPAMFAVDGAPELARAFKEEGSPNGPENGAAAGSLLTVIATGFGDTLPGSRDGAVASAEQALTHRVPVLVIVGENTISADAVTTIPGQPEAVTQVRFRLPAGIAVGKQAIRFVHNETDRRELSVFVR
jgi:uncharacterized protein (TIGR03437 family)